MDLITPEDEALFLRRYRGPNSRGDLAYARREAVAYADRYADGMAEWVKSGVAALAFRYVYLDDIGEKRLIRMGIDCLLAVGRACR